VCVCVCLCLCVPNRCAGSSSAQSPPRSAQDATTCSRRNTGLSRGCGNDKASNVCNFSGRPLTGRRLCPKSTSPLLRLLYPVSVVDVSRHATNLSKSYAQGLCTARIGAPRLHSKPGDRSTSSSSERNEEACQRQPSKRSLLVAMCQTCLNTHAKF
jgi:hypothetical protein